MTLTAAQLAAREGKEEEMTETNTALAVAERAETQPAAPTPPTSPAITPMEMLQIAVERGADLDQLQKLMDLQDRWEKNEARKAFDRALSAFKKLPPTIVKNRHVGFASRRTGDSTEYDHATLDQVCDCLGRALSEHGLTYRWKVEQPDAGAVRVTCILSHELGHAEETALQGPPDTSGSKNAIQAVGSTVTYLQRYSLLAAVGLATTDQDDDGAGGGEEKISAEQKDALIALIKETGADTAKFLAYLGVSSLDELPAGWFERAKSALEKKREAS